MKRSFGFMFLTFTALVFFSSFKITQEETDGIRFKSLRLSDAKILAKKNKQLIFIDAHTSWCGPCKRMAATSFKNAEVGRLFNTKFINLKIDVEQDSDGAELVKMYKVRAYPTLLIIDADGKLIKALLGFQTEQGLIAFANSID
jgi:thioredoxin 1